MQLNTTAKIFLKCICLFILPAMLFYACSPANKTNKFPVIPFFIDSIPAPTNSEVEDLKKKYAHSLNVSPENITDIKLYVFIDEWLSTPYKWGGMDKYGIDCSGFVQRLFNDVYGCRIPRTSQEQYLLERTRL